MIHGLVHASVLMLPPLLGDIQRSFRVPLLAVLTVANAMYLVYGLCAIPAGFLADRFGSRRMLVIAAGGCTVSLLLVAAAPSFPLLAAGLILLGISAGVYHPSGLSLLSRGVATGERGRAIGIHGAGGNFGEAIAPAWAALFATTVGWRFGFAAAAALSLACAVLALGLPATDAAAAPALPWPRPPRAAGASGPPSGRWDAPCTALPATGHCCLLLFSLVAAGFVYRGFLTFLSMHLAEAGGMGPRASYLMSVVLVAGIIAQRFGGELVDRRSGERLYLLRNSSLGSGPGAAGPESRSGGRGGGGPGVRVLLGADPAGGQRAHRGIRPGGRPRPAVRHPVRRHLRDWLFRDHRRGVSSGPGRDTGGLPGPGGGGRAGRVVRGGASGASKAEPCEISRLALVR